MKFLFKILLCFFILTCLSFVIKKDKEISVVIDVAHGGKDFGSKTNEFSEKEIVFSISKKIKELNNDSNVTLKFTRENDESLTLEERVKFINEVKPALMISLHVNKSPDYAETGFEVYISNNEATFEKSNELANEFVSLFSIASPLRNRGVNTAKFFILRKTNVPSILIELGFISNDFDRNYILDEKIQNEVAKSILEFIGSLKS